MYVRFWFRCIHSCCKNFQGKQIISFEYFYSTIDNNVQCSICMEDFKLNEEAKKLPCKHYFHTQCITEWLKLVNSILFSKIFVRLFF
jgi:hypothetical protein